MAIRLMSLALSASLHVFLLAALTSPKDVTIRTPTVVATPRHIIAEFHSNRTCVSSRRSLGARLTSSQGGAHFGRQRELIFASLVVEHWPPAKPFRVFPAYAGFQIPRERPPCVAL